MIWFSSDYHFNHNKDFIYKARGFETVEEMNEAIIERHNSVVKPNDTVFVLGDLCLGGGSDEIKAKNKELIERLNGRLYIIRGNHDTDARLALYGSCRNVIDYNIPAKWSKLEGITFILSHYPMLTGNGEEKGLYHMPINLYGHTHQKEKFSTMNPFSYHVGVDSHDCYPVSLDTIIKDLKGNLK